MVWLGNRVRGAGGVAGRWAPGRRRGVHASVLSCGSSARCCCSSLPLSLSVCLPSLFCCCAWGARYGRQRDGGGEGGGSSSSRVRSLCLASRLLPRAAAVRLPSLLVSKTPRTHHQQLLPLPLPPAASVNSPVSARGAPGGAPAPSGGPPGASQLVPAAPAPLRPLRLPALPALPITPQQVPQQLLIDPSPLQEHPGVEELVVLVQQLRRAPVVSLCRDDAAGRGGRRGAGWGEKTRGEAGRVRIVASQAQISGIWRAAAPRAAWARTRRPGCPSRGGTSSPWPPGRSRAKGQSLAGRSCA